MRRLRAVVGTRAPDDPAQELVRRVAAGDDGAFADLYDLIAPHVHAIVLRVVRDPAQAEEVSQEVLVELWRIATRYDPALGSVRSWAATIAHRRAVDRVRSTQSARDRDDREVAERVAAVPHDEVSEIVEDRLDRERVTRALGSLTPAQRESIELAYFNGYTYREVAVVLDVPEGTIKTRIRDGLIRLRDELEVG